MADCQGIGGLQVRCDPARIDLTCGRRSRGEEVQRQALGKPTRGHRPAQEFQQFLTDPFARRLGQRRCELLDPRSSPVIEGEVGELGKETRSAEEPDRVVLEIGARDGTQATVGQIIESAGEIDQRPVGELPTEGVAAEITPEDVVFSGPARPGARVRS